MNGVINSCNGWNSLLRVWTAFKGDLIRRKQGGGGGLRGVGGGRLHARAKAGGSALPRGLFLIRAARGIVCALHALLARSLGGSTSGWSAQAFVPKQTGSLSELALKSCKDRQLVFLEMCAIKSSGLLAGEASVALAASPRSTLPARRCSDFPGR